SGAISWYDFAVEIFKQFGKTIEVKPIKTKDYPTAAKRPEYSVLKTTKIQEEFNLQVRHWKLSLKNITPPK
ncbi:MAG: sugar nucleotide-binding protein, partial [Bacteroidetes bacterium]|nr:sugar nucleotide-binding protein [Bacteroidota bacterium]